MKKWIALMLVLAMCLSLCACGKEKLTPEERLPKEVDKYLRENFRIEVGSEVSKPVNVDIASIVEVKENQWAVMGTYTVKLGKEVMSAKFGLVATYHENSNKFTYSDESFDSFQ